VPGVNGSVSSVVTNSFAVPVGAPVPARQVRKLAYRVIAQIADRFRVSAGDPAARRLLGSERAEPAGEPALAASSFGQGIHLPAETPGIRRYIRRSERR
jgi:hypothetical protein